MILTSYEFGHILAEAGIISLDDKITRVTIDAPAGKPVLVHITKVLEMEDEGAGKFVEQIFSYKLVKYPTVDDLKDLTGEDK